MRIKVTSAHKTSGNVPVSNFCVSIAEFYIGVNTGIISLRTNIFTEDVDGDNVITEYPFTLLPTDVLSSCINQDLKVVDYAQKINTLNLQGTEYQIQAQLLFSLIFDKMEEVNTVIPNSIIYELEGF